MKYKNYVYVITGIIFCLILSTKAVFSQSDDTTFSANLYSEAKKDLIRVKREDDPSNKKSEGWCKITVNDVLYIDTNNSYFDFVRIIDIDKQDNFKEIAVGSGMNDYYDYSIYRYDGKSITKLGIIYSLDEAKFLGNGMIAARMWMGFWYYDFEYKFNASKNTFEEIMNDEYDVKAFSDMENYPIIVSEPFNVNKERKDNSAVQFKTKKGERIKILKAYIKEKCTGEEYEKNCFWYLIQNSKGEKGWVRLSNFMNNVTGIPWAG